METKLKNIIKYSQKAKLSIYISYFVILLGLILAIVAASQQKPFEQEPLYIPAIICIVLGYILSLVFAFLFVKKIKAIANQLDILSKDYLTLLKNYYLYPLSVFSKLVKVSNNLIGTLSDENFLKDIQSEKSNSRIIFETERLVVRQLEKQDVNTIYEYRNQEEINYFQTYDAFTKKEISEMIVKNKNVNLFSDVALFAIANKEDNKIIGELFTSYKNNAKEYIIGFTLTKENQNKGYAFEAVSELLVNVATQNKNVIFTCTIYEKNLKSIKLIEKLEFKKTNQFYGPKGNIFVYQKEIN